jgi:L,D-transpeptidase YcbB
MRSTKNGGFRKLCLAAVSAVALLCAAPPALAQVTVFKQAVAEAAADDADIAAFFRETGYAPLWTGGGEVSAARLGALMRAVSEAEAHGLPAGRYTPERVEAIVGAITTERDRGRAEVELSRLFLRYARDVQTGVLTPANVDPRSSARCPCGRAPAQLRAFAAADPDAFLRALPPATPQYAQLMKHRMRFERLVAAGGWGEPVRTSRTIRPGDSGGDVVALRNRLIRMGYLERTATAAYDPRWPPRCRPSSSTTADAGRRRRPGTVEEINVQAETRLAQILVAMERQRWMNFEGGLGDRHIWVNLTDFRTR